MSESDTDVNSFEYIHSDGTSGKTSEHEDVASYRAWLESKYDNVASLNEACGGNYSSFVEFSRQSISKYQEKSSTKDTEESICAKEEHNTKVSGHIDLTNEKDETKDETKEKTKDDDENVEEAKEEAESVEEAKEEAESVEEAKEVVTDDPMWGISRAANMLSSFWSGKQDGDTQLPTPPPVPDHSEPDVNQDPNPVSEEELSDNSPTNDDRADDSTTEDTTTEGKVGADDCKEDRCFVIVANDEPAFYMDTRQSARDKMRELANRLCSGYADYNVYIESPSLDEIHVVGNHRYFVISHTRILDRLRVQEVPKFTDLSFTIYLAKNLLRTVYGVW